MKFVIGLLVPLLVGCATQLASLTYKRYENPKGGIVEHANLTPGAGPNVMRLIEKRDSIVSDLMTRFCAPEPYRIVAEGIMRSDGGSVSTPIGSAIFTAPVRSNTPYIQFACGAKP